MPRISFAQLSPARWWLGSLRQWHWISSALCLVGMLLFSLTGITLNHAGQIEAEPNISNIESRLPPEQQAQLQQVQGQDGPLPKTLRRWLWQEHGISVKPLPVEWFDSEAYVALPRPGGDAWLSLDAATGEFIYEKTTRGAVAYLNDLHKGRNTGTAWSWFIDIFAGACIVFSITGLLLLQRHAISRPSTWPMVALGLVIPLLLAILFIH